MAASPPAGQFKFIESLETRLCFSAFPAVLVPDDLAAAPLTSTSVRLMWTDVAANELKYVISRSSDGVNFREVINTTPNAATWVDNNLLPDTQYFYTMRAVALTAISHTSNTATVTTLTTAEDAFAQVDINTGELTVRGTSAADVVLVELSSTNTNVTLNNVTLPFATTGVKRIKVLTFSGNDRITIGPGIGSVYAAGGAGNDTITGNDGDDRIDGGDGNDSLKGGDGNDTLSGGDGKDIIYGLGGDDEIRGGNGSDRLFGGDGDDLIYGDVGNDKLFGDDGTDTLFAGGGHDTLTQN